MKKIGLLVCCILFFKSFSSNAQMKTPNNNESKAVSFYDFTVKDINGKDFPFKNLKGKKVLIVNTASQCGFTPQYEELEKLYNAYKDKNFVIIGFPANNFGAQEPGTNQEIKVFCTKNYGITFPMMEKISVDGKDMSEVYQFLTRKEVNGKIESMVEWNFQKYLVSEKGEVIEVFSSKTSPLSEEVINAINIK